MKKTRPRHFLDIANNAQISFIDFSAANRLLRVERIRVTGSFRTSGPGVIQVNTSIPANSRYATVAIAGWGLTFSHQDHHFSTARVLTNGLQRVDNNLEIEISTTLADKNGDDAISYTVDLDVTFYT